MTLVHNNQNFYILYFCCLSTGCQKPITNVPRSSKLQLIILAIEMQNRIHYRFEFTFDSNVMNHFLENIFKLFMILYILCNQIIGLNSKSSILWKLNDKSGKIYSFSDNDQHVSEKLTLCPLTLMCCYTYINILMYRYDIDLIVLYVVCYVHCV